MAIKRNGDCRSPGGGGGGRTMINAGEHRSGPCKTICADPRKYEVTFEKSEAWRAWILRFDRTARQLSSLRLQRIGADIMEGRTITDELQESADALEMSAQIKVDELSLVVGPPAEGWPILAAPLLSRMARPSYQDRGQQRADLMSNQSRKMCCLSGLALMQ